MTMKRGVAAMRNSNERTSQSSEIQNQPERSVSTRRKSALGRHRQANHVWGSDKRKKAYLHMTGRLRYVT